MIRKKSILAVVGIALFAMPASAEGFKISLDEMLAAVTASAKADGAALEVKKVGCAENPKPGDDTKKIISCSHSVGQGRVIITNADPSGSLLDISTQMWPEPQAAKVVGWIASAINGTLASDHSDATAKLVAEAKANNTSAGTLGKGEFVVLSMGKNFMISVSAP